MSESAWKWGPYERGMGVVDRDDPRVIVACAAIKEELAWRGFDDLDLTTPRFGPKTHRAVVALQRSVGLEDDGRVGPKTANALWEARIEQEEIPHGWLRAQIHWESGDDPGAQFTNPDGSRDRGLIQLNSGATSLSEEDVWKPAVSIHYLANHLRGAQDRFRDCRVNGWRLAVGAWRTPVGAEEWCDNEALLPNKDGTWGERAAYYVLRVDNDGRLNWA